MSIDDGDAPLAVGTPARPGGGTPTPSGGLIPPGQLAPTLPWWALRLALALVAAGTVAAVGMWTPTAPFLLAVAGALGLAAAVVPATHVPAAFLTALVLLALGAERGVTAWASLTVLGLHAVHVLAALAAVVPANTAVERAALRPTLERFVVAQAAGQVLVVLAWLVSP
ncbi:hypothetical protein [Jiangella gansuensis]|uniref:hypothetical protein n=1 Tax=Jiangella gansuensis TaxID=281473 RepID=UPI00047E5529|nr:hypothetical protein [Jiangella gansuensis]